MKQLSRLTMMAALGLTALAFGHTQKASAVGDNTIYVELLKPGGEGQPCAAVGAHRVDYIEDGNTTTHYTEGNGSTTFTVATPVQGEVLTVKYYKTNGTLAGTTTATVEYDAQTGDPVVLDPGTKPGDDCSSWNAVRTFHVVYSPS